MKKKEEKFTPAEIKRLRDFYNGKKKITPIKNEIKVSVKKSLKEMVQERLNNLKH